MPNRSKPQYPGKDLEAMAFAQNYHRWILAEFIPYLGHSVAEIGAGSGHFSRLLLDTKIRFLKAFEPSQEMFLLLAETLKHEHRAEIINDFLRQNYSSLVDSVIYVNVLEHIEDDILEIATAYSHLKQGGHLLIFVPANQWLYSNFDKTIGHFRRYSKTQLCDAVVKSGFSIVHVKYFDLAGIIPWYINFVLLKRQIGSKDVNIYDKLIVPVTRSLESFFTPPIGKNILLVARKP